MRFTKELWNEKREELKEKMRNGKPREKLSYEHKIKISESLKRLYKEGKMKPYWLGKNQSKEAKLKNSQSHKGKIFSEEHKRKISEFQRGKKVSEETKQKMRNHKVSEETKQKISISKSNPSKETIKKLKINALRQFKDGMPKETKIKIGLANKGKKRTEEWKNKHRENAKINPNYGMKNKICTIEHRQKISLAKKGKPQSENAKKKYKEWRKNFILPLKDTSIEFKIQNFLKELGIDFFTHQYVKEIEHSYQCDILIPTLNLVIECDGNYWHKYPIGTDIDHIRTKELLEKGFKVLRLWEVDIRKMQLEEFKNKINIIK